MSSGVTEWSKRQKEENYTHDETLLFPHHDDRVCLLYRYDACHVIIGASGIAHAIAIAIAIVGLQPDPRQTDQKGKIQNFKI